MISQQLRFMKRIGKANREWRFYCSANQQQKTDPSAEFVETAETAAVQELLSRSGISLNDSVIDRLTLGDSFVCIVDANKTILSYGWKTSRTPFLISELGLGLLAGGSDILYDFYTPKQLQGNGYYTCLLRNLSNASSMQRAWIYAANSNPGSWKAIERSGFARQSVIKMVLQGRLHVGRIA